MAFPSPSRARRRSPTPPPPPGDAGRAAHPARDLRRAIADFDRRVDRAFDAVRADPALDRLLYATTELGDFALVWHIVGAARGLRSDRDAADALRLSALLGFESVLVNGVVKSFFRRTRPQWDQPRSFRIRQPRTSSFPSGHASSAFAAAAILSENDPLKPLWYGLATLVAASRVHVRIHHASDVAAGALLGTVLGRVARRAWPQPVDGNPFSGFRSRRNPSRR